jgi:hypothetical protein
MGMDSRIPIGTDVLVLDIVNDCVNKLAIDMRSETIDKRFAYLPVFVEDRFIAK